jgi:hypothetical protein
MSSAGIRGLGLFVLSFVGGCDGRYLVKGSVFTVAGAPLDAVEVSAHGVKQEASLPDIRLASANTDTHGVYRLTFLGPPASSGQRIALIFQRRGYASKCVFVSSSRANACDPGPGFNRCWTLDAFLGDGNENAQGDCHEWQ